MTAAKENDARPVPFGVERGLLFTGIFFLFICPVFFVSCYSQVTYFYLAGAFEIMASSVLDRNFYQLYHATLLVNIPLALLAGCLILTGKKSARKASNLFLAVSITAHLLLVISIPSAIKQTIPSIVMQPSRLAFGAFVFLGVIAMLYLNASKRGENTYSRFHGFTVFRRKQSRIYPILFGCWSLIFAGIWLIALIAFLSRYGAPLW